MELLFVSGSTNHFDKSHPDFYFNLEKSSGIPRPHSAKPWDRSKISPLRDRLMIAWIFTHKEAMKELYKIVTSLDTALVQDAEENRSPDRGQDSRAEASGTPKKKIVGVACGDGLVLSPCFVEKLYDHYQTSPPVDQLVVKRLHMQTDAVKVPRERLKWQQLSCGSSRSRKKTEFDNIQQLKVLTTSRDWLDLPVDLSDSIEDAYSKDPLSNSTKIGGVVIDFESGHTTTLQTQQISYLRCSVVPKSYSVQARAIGHKQYKVFVSCFEAAGILPYSVHPVTGEAVFLIGRITYGSWTWCDFGGLKMRYRINRETPAETAARECFEESLGVFGSSAELLKAIRSYKENNVFKVINEESLYVGHFIRIPFDHYPSKFAAKVLKDSGEDEPVEVDSIRWFPLSSIKKAVQLTQSSASKVAVQPIRENDGSLDTRSLRLRLEFTHSLCIAEDCGVLDSIEYITAMIHRGVDLAVSEDDSMAEDKSSKQSPRASGGLDLPSLGRTSPHVNSTDTPSPGGTVTPPHHDSSSTDSPCIPLSLADPCSSGGPPVSSKFSELSLVDDDSEEPKSKPSDHVTVSERKHHSPHKGSRISLYGMFSGKFSYTDPFLQYV